MHLGKVKNYCLTNTLNLAEKYRSHRTNYEKCNRYGNFFSLSNLYYWFRCSCCFIYFLSTIFPGLQKMWRIDLYDYKRPFTSRLSSNPKFAVVKKEKYFLVSVRKIMNANHWSRWIIIINLNSKTHSLLWFF